MPIAEHDELVNEMVVVRFVDNFLCYVSDLLALIFATRPETLRSGEQERLDFILLYNTIEELRHALAEKRVERLAFLGMRELNEYLLERLKFPLASGDLLEDAVRLIEIRNIIVHNRAIVSAISARRVPSLSSHLGKRLKIPDIWKDRFFLRQLALDIDVRAAKKFDLPVAQLPPHPESI